MASIIKEKMMEELRGQFEGNPYAFISRFESLTVAQMSDLRRALEKVSKRSLVVKHALVKRVFDELQQGDAAAFLDGSVVMTFGDKDPQKISKALVEYAKGNNKFAPSGVVFEQKVYDQEFVKRLAALPSREELLTQVVIRVKSPISGFVMTLSQLVRGLVVALNEVKKQRESSVATA